MFDEEKASIELNAENILITDGGVLQVGVPLLNWGMACDKGLHHKQ